MTWERKKSRKIGQLIIKKDDTIIKTVLRP